MPVVYGHVIRVDEYIIKINYNTNIQKIRENIVYESLKGYRNISKTKWYYRLFKRFITISESSLSFVLIKYANQIVCMEKIYLGIYLDFTEWVKQIRNKRE